MNKDKEANDGLAALGAAEFLAANELTEDIGIAMSFAGSLGNLMRDQFAAHLQAQSDSVAKLASEPLPLVATELAFRQGLIAATGMLSFNELLWRQSRELFQVHDNLWRTFGKVTDRS